MEPLYQDTLKQGHLDKQDTVVPNAMCVYVQPLKSGHLTNQDTFFHPKIALVSSIAM